MIPDIHQSIEEVIKSASPEDRLLWQQIRLLTGENAAVQAFNYQGTVAGAPFFVNDANIVYLCNFSTWYGDGGAVLAVPYVATYQAIGGALMGYHTNAAPFWDTTAALVRYVINDLWIRNVYFRYVTVLSYINVNFTGYKIRY